MTQPAPIWMNIPSSPGISPSLSNSPSPHASQQDRGFAQDIVLNIFEPGVNQSVLIFLNLTFVLLLLTLVGLTVLVGFDLHILFLMVLAVGLMAGFNWFISQLPNHESQSAATDGASTDRTKED